MCFTTIYNLDHSTAYFVNRTWSRPLSTGTYPSPKACAVMVLHPRQDCLLLFGGWTHPRSVSKYCCASNFKLHKLNYNLIIIKLKHYLILRYLDLILLNFPQSVPPPSVVETVQRAPPLRHLRSPLDARRPILRREASSHGRPLRHRPQQVITLINRSGLSNVS